MGEFLWGLFIFVLIYDAVVETFHLFIDNKIRKKKKELRKRANAAWLCDRILAILTGMFFIIVCLFLFLVYLSMMDTIKVLDKYSEWERIKDK